MSIVFALACSKAEQLINTALEYAPEKQDIFADMAGKSLRVSSHLPASDVFISCTASELFIQPADDNLADVTSADAQLSGSMPALISLAMETRAIDNPESRDTYLADDDNTDSHRTQTYDGPVVISGDIEFIVNLRQRLQSLDIDWEAWLATLIGDIPAHLMATTARKAEHWRRQARDRSADGLENYFQHEWSSSPWQNSARQFTETLVTLGSDRALIEKRLNSLKSQLLRFIG